MTLDELVIDSFAGGGGTREGIKAAGRLLDGVEHNGMPKAQ